MIRSIPKPWTVILSCVGNNGPCNDGKVTPCLIWKELLKDVNSSVSSRTV